MVWPIPGYLAGVDRAGLAVQREGFGHAPTCPLYHENKGISWRAQALIRQRWENLARPLYHENKGISWRAQALIRQRWENLARP